jgi:hypothetical protein
MRIRSAWYVNNDSHRTRTRVLYYTSASMQLLAEFLSSRRWRSRSTTTRSYQAREITLRACGPLRAVSQSPALHSVSILPLPFPRASDGLTLLPHRHAQRTQHGVSSLMARRSSPARGESTATYASFASTRLVPQASPNWPSLRSPTVSPPPSFRLQELLFPFFCFQNCSHCNRFSLAEVVIFFVSFLVLDLFSVAPSAQFSVPFSPLKRARTVQLKISHRLRQAR